MVAVEAVMNAAGFGAAVLAYITFKLNDSDNVLVQILSNLFFVLTLSFVLFLVWGGLQIADNNAATYLSGGSVALLESVMWTLILVMVGFTIRIIWLLIVSIHSILINYTQNLRSGKRK